MSDKTYLGSIIRISTTPPFLTILPDPETLPLLQNTNTLHQNHAQHPDPLELKSLTLTQIALENFLHSLSLGAAQVSFIVKRSPQGCYYADEVRVTGFVNDQRWKGLRPWDRGYVSESWDIFGGGRRGGYGGRWPRHDGLPRPPQNISHPYPRPNYFPRFDSAGLRIIEDWEVVPSMTEARGRNETTGANRGSGITVIPKDDRMVLARKKSGGLGPQIEGERAGGEGVGGRIGVWRDEVWRADGEGGRWGRLGSGMGGMERVREVTESPGVDEEGGDIAVVDEVA